LRILRRCGRRWRSRRRQGEAARAAAAGGVFEAQERFSSGMGSPGCNRRKTRAEKRREAGSYRASAAASTFSGLRPPKVEAAAERANRLVMPGGRRPSSAGATPLRLRLRGVAPAAASLTVAFATVESAFRRLVCDCKTGYDNQGRPPLVSTMAGTPSEKFRTPTIPGIPDHFCCKIQTEFNSGIFSLCCLK
jgi:hypothetical protein